MLGVGGNSMPGLGSTVHPREGKVPGGRVGVGVVGAQVGEGVQRQAAWGKVSQGKARRLLQGPTGGGRRGKGSGRQDRQVNGRSGTTWGNGKMFKTGGGCGKGVLGEGSSHILSVPGRQSLESIQSSDPGKCHHHVHTIKGVGKNQRGRWGSL